MPKYACMVLLGPRGPCLLHVRLFEYRPGGSRWSFPVPGDGEGIAFRAHPLGMSPAFADLSGTLGQNHLFEVSRLHGLPLAAAAHVVFLYIKA